MCKLSPVPFHGDTIYCFEHDGQPYAPMRPIVENLGIDWSAQAAKFRANKTRWGVVMISTPANSTVGIIATVAKDGKEREMLCLPVRKLPAWLASINPKKVRSELRAKIELYQAECDDVLWNYWVNGKGIQPKNHITIRTLSDLYALRYAQYEHLSKLERQAVSRRISKRFRNNFGFASLARVPREKWQEAALLIMAPMQRSGYGGLLKGSNNPDDSIHTKFRKDHDAIPTGLSGGLAQLADKLDKIAKDMSEAAMLTSSLAKKCLQ